MKENYINTLCAHLIDKEDYVPMVDQNGASTVREDLKMLQKISSGHRVIVDILDGDLYHPGIIQNRLKAHSDWLDTIDDRQPLYFFCIFVFHSALEEDKLNAIREGQYEQLKGRKYLSCFTVNLGMKEIQGYFELPVKFKDLKESLRKPLTEETMEYRSVAEINELAKGKKENYYIPFKAKVPVVTYVLIAVNVIITLLVYLYSYLKAGSFVHGSAEAYDYALYFLGEKYNAAIVDGQYWRFITPMFLHAGITHLAVNCYSLYAVGTTAERLYGHLKFSLIYFIAGFMGSIASFIFSSNPSVGASGAIFGILGALLYFGIEYPDVYKRFFGSNVLVMIAVNIGFGFSVARVDNSAHIGGLIGGFLAAGVVKIKGVENKFLSRPVFIFATAALILAGLCVGFYLNMQLWKTL